MGDRFFNWKSLGQGVLEACGVANVGYRELAIQWGAGNTGLHLVLELRREEQAGDVGF